MQDFYSMFLYFIFAIIHDFFTLKIFWKASSVRLREPRPHACSFVPRPCWGSLVAQGPLGDLEGRKSHPREAAFSVPAGSARSKALLLPRRREALCLGAM